MKVCEVCFRKRNLTLLCHRFTRYIDKLVKNNKLSLIRMVKNNLSRPTMEYKLGTIILVKNKLSLIRKF